MTEILTPNAVTSEYDLSVRGGKLAFWKQILPMKQIHYTAKDGTRQTANFDRQYLTDLANNRAVDQVGFLLADKDNAHTMDPERWRGTVEAMEVRDDGLYGKIVFPNADAAKAVIDNPNLGVSARIREGVAKSDGTQISRGIIHVLGTLDPQVEGMSPWQTADLSQSDKDVLDLSNERFEEMATKKLSDYSEADIDKMTEDELDSFLAEFAPEFDGTVFNEGEGDEPEESDEPDESDDDEEFEEPAPSPELVGAGADMSKVQSDIDLANGRAAYAEQQARQALSELAQARWDKQRDGYLSEGVPPHMLDLAAPILARHSDMVIDLSNEDGEDVNVAQIVRGLLDAAKGVVDLSNEAGHSGTFRSGDGDDPDAAMLATWAQQG